VKHRLGTIRGFVAGTTIAAALVWGCTSEPPRLNIHNARVEFSEVMRDEASVYLTIVNSGGPDRLLRARVDIPGAEADIHEMRGDVMVIAKSLAIPAKNSLVLARVGPHIMVANLPQDLKAGSQFTLTLQFQRSGELQVLLEFTKPRSEPVKPPATHEYHKH